MTGFEPRTSGIRSDHSTNWATTTAPNLGKVGLALVGLEHSSLSGGNDEEHDGVGQKSED